MKRSGFTLVELLITIAIIAIVSSVIFVLVDPVQRFKDSRNSKRKQDVESILNAVRLYQIDNKGLLPAGIDSNWRMLGTASDGCDVPCVPNLFPNYALNFAVGDYVQVAPNAENIVLDKWSLEIKFFVDNDVYTDTSLFQSRMYRYPGGVQMYPGGSTLLKISSNGDKYNLDFLFQKTGPGYPSYGLGAWFYNSNKTLKKNDWNDYVLTVDSGKVFSYINGVLAGQADYSGVVYNNVTQLYKEIGDVFFHIIGANLAKGNVRNLKIDDFRMYKRVLTPEEITSKTYNKNNLWFGFNFNEGSGKDLIDLANDQKYLNVLKNNTSWFSVLLENSSGSLQASCLDLSNNLISQFAQFPKDPTLGTTEKSYYAIKKEDNNLVTVWSCGAEDQIIKVSK